MSIESTSPTDDDQEEEETFKERCEAIANDEEVSDDVRRIARGLLSDIESGDLDAT